jgi:hypothetical protein
VSGSNPRLSSKQRSRTRRARLRSGCSARGRRWRRPPSAARARVAEPRRAPEGVTPNRDVYEPGVTLPCGALPVGGGLFVRMQVLNSVERRLAEARGDRVNRTRARDRAARAAAAHGLGRRQQCRARTLPPSSCTLALMQPEVGANVECLKAAAAEHEADADVPRVGVHRKAEGRAPEADGRAQDTPEECPNSDARARCIPRREGRVWRH